MNRFGLLFRSSSANSGTVRPVNAHASLPLKHMSSEGPVSRIHRIPTDGSFLFLPDGNPNSIMTQIFPEVLIAYRRF